MTQVITEPLSYQQAEHMRSAVERMAAFAAAAGFAWLSPLLKARDCREDSMFAIDNPCPFNNLRIGTVLHLQIGTVHQFR